MTLLEVFRRYRRIVADGDFDGVAAAILLGHALGPVEVEFPAPQDTAPRSGVIVIERPERAGADSVVIDHHAEGNEGYVVLPSGERLSFGPKGSVASLVAEILEREGVELPEELRELVRYADIIDSTPPARVADALASAGLKPRVYSGYRMLIANPVWRREIAARLARGDAVDAADYMLELFAMAGAVADELVPAVAEEIAGRAKVVETGKGPLVIFPVYYGERIEYLDGLEVDLEQAAMKAAQGVLEKRYPDAAAIVAYIHSPQGNGLSISSPKGIAAAIATALRDRGLAASGGGRPNVAGAQRVTFSYEEAPEILRRIIDEL